MKKLKIVCLCLTSLFLFSCSNEDDITFVDEISLLEKSNTINWVGTWSSTYGELRLVEKGQLIYGDYADIGVIYGYRHYINGKEYFEGTFDNYRMNRKGIIRFEMNNSNFNNSFSGKWTWGNTPNWYNWNGTKTSKKEPILQSFYNVKGRVFDNNTFQTIQNPISIEVFKNGIRHFSTTSENGFYSLQLPKGNWELKVSNVAYQNFSRNIEVKENYDYNNYFTQNIYLTKR
ncbi:hypothetical protein [Aquimarina sp. Aq107]|uniref:hypothetical protein n=1 Tax=Aquimarina sp. Aq107 TaxID=1191912 RepID=UPI000D556CA7|nr:hypothetical protein [Aquimarina sp. Aq107]